MSENQQELDTQGIGCILVIAATSFVTGVVVGVLLMTGWLG